MIDHLIPCKVLSVALLIHSGGHPVNIPVLEQNESIAKKQQSDVNIQSRMSGSPLELQWILDLDLTMLANLTTSFRCLNLSLLAKSDYDYIERKNFIELLKNTQIVEFLSLVELLKLYRIRMRRIDKYS